MAERRFIDPHLRATPISRDTGSVPGTALPEELCEDSSRRLQIACIVWAVLWGIGLVINNVVTRFLDLPAGTVVVWSGVANAVAVACILLSLGLYRYAKRSACNYRQLIDLGLVYEVILALGIGIANQWVPQALAGRLSWICILILVHPMIVPNTPRKTFVAALLAASMDPVGLLVAKARGLELPPVALLFWTYLPNYICAVLATIPAHIITRLGRQVSKARELGSYQLDELIGRGGMGEVWRANHRLLARPAAIKLIRPELLALRGIEAEQLMVHRFKREAESAAALRSQHTVQLYDFGVARDGTFYLVMELLDGIDLESLIRQFGPQPPARVVYLLRQVCHSLAEAHARGLIHRDIKPANIHLCRMGLEYDFIKVLDFGLVKRDPQLSSAQTLMTAPDVTTGTPAYMPPEMANGDPLDRRLDIYSLGCVGYWLLTGRLVFEADTPLKMMLQHMQARPVPPSERAGPGISAALDRVVLSCLEKDPKSRPSNAEQLSRLLAQCEAGEPWSQERAERWWREHLPGPAPGDVVGEGSPEAQSPSIVSAVHPA